MFQELEEEEHVDVTAESPDRLIAYALWSRNDVGLTPEEAWSILHERYPDDPRFLLLQAYAELADAAGLGSWTPGYFLKKVERILGSSDGAIAGRVRDLLGYGGAVLASAKDDDAKLLSELRARVDANATPSASDAPPPSRPAADKRDERAGLRLRRFEREVLKELHDRTEGGKDLGVRAPPPPPVSPKDVWAEAVADKTRERKRYAADARFETGDLVEHTKFGVGVVTGKEPGRVAILFESGARKLVCA